MYNQMAKYSYKRDCKKCTNKEEHYFINAMDVALYTDCQRWRSLMG